ncbi:MAG: hypothetical protein HYY26_02390, partial [Acidobacteria bacterium]|nr:hypothetical protein [Acidobacteriota bacterium]
LYLYYFLARHEERRCLARYGESYRDYLARTGMFFPRSWFGWVPQWLPERGSIRAAALAASYVLLVGAAVLVGFWLRSYSLAHVASYAERDLAALSPAQLPASRLQQAVEVALGDPEVAVAVAARGYGQGEKLLLYVVPIDWRLPDLPMEAQPRGGHQTPPEFDPERLKVLVTRVRLHDRGAEGLDIVKKAVKREPILLVKLDLSRRAVLSHETPPATVRWGDVPTPYF